ncbi:MAG: aspartate ammonia-lyase [Acidiferrobacteraceae bacterium]
MQRAMRTERDSLGEYPVPEDAWYGIQTARAADNFRISGRLPDGDFIIAHARIKRAAAAVNRDSGWLDPALADAIIVAADAIIGGAHRDQFIVDRFQAGAGTSHNMNTNEVIANLANVALGGQRGLYRPVHPNDHVNMAQSTNDTVPTAIRLAALAKLPRLTEALGALALQYRTLAERERDTLKSARTHLQDAVPMLFGQEFSAYASTLERCRDRMNETSGDLSELGLGGTAAGTGLNAPPGYPVKVTTELSRLTGAKLRPAADLFAKMQSMTDLQRLSNEIRATALELTRIANDMRLLASGPRTGFGEITLKPVQPGSSIMPGKVNPVLFEMLNQVCYQVLGQDAAIALMTQAGQLELNVMMPALGSALFDAMDWLTNAIRATAERGVPGLTVHRDRCAYYAHASAGLATLLNPHIGYAAAAEIAKESVVTGTSVRDLVVARKLMSAEAFDALLIRAARGDQGLPPGNDAPP